MRIKKVYRYYAECGRGFWKMCQATDHEKICKCWSNPKNRTCKTCCYGERELEEVGGNKPGRGVKG